MGEKQRRLDYNDRESHNEKTVLREIDAIVNI